MNNTKQIAKNFLDFYYRTEAKHKETLAKLSRKMGFKTYLNGWLDLSNASPLDEAELEDELLITLTKCVKRIEEKGLVLGKSKGKELTWDETFDAYFYTALNNNLIQFAKKKETKRKKESKYKAHYTASGQDRTQPFNIELDMNEIDEQQDYEDLVKEAVEQLPQRYKDVLYMIADGCKYKDIEQLLELSTGKVKMRIMVARRMVKEYMEQKLGVSYLIGDID